MRYRRNALVVALGWDDARNGGVRLFLNDRRGAHRHCAGGRLGMHAGPRRLRLSGCRNGRSHVRRGARVDHGVVTLSHPGQVFQNAQVTGAIVVTAQDVTIRNVRLIVTDEYYGISIKPGNTGTPRTRTGWSNTSRSI
jgi:hypothetical protein